MYPKIKEELDEGTLLLEWDNSKGKPPSPLLKVLLFNPHNIKGEICE